MTDHEYEQAIASIISDFRYSELGKHLDATHVHRWVSQFDVADRSIVLEETFHVLSRSYYKKDKLDAFYKRVLACLAKENALETYTFINNQEKGNSQQRILQELQIIAKKCYNTALATCNNTDEAADVCVYVDDALYTGRRIRDDLGRFLNSVKNKFIIVFLIASYSNNLSFCQRELGKLAQTNGNSIIWRIEREFQNDKNVIQRYDTVWPHKNELIDERIRRYGEKIASWRKMTYICHDDTQTESLFSSPEHSQVVARVFLRKGLAIRDSIKKTSFRPLGFDNNVSFGFGSFFVTDMNISNTSPLVFWWGSMEKTANPALNCWYPLLPRRENETFIDEVIIEEKARDLKNYYDVILTTYKLARERAVKERASKERTSIWEKFNLDDLHEKREQDDLLQYLYSLNLDQIKIIGIVMYIGRDLNIEPTEEYYHQIEEYDGEGECPRWQPYPVDDPNTVVASWLSELEETFGDDKYDWVEQIHQKMPLDKYLKQAFFKLGILDGKN